MRVKGVFSGPVEGGGTPAGYFTSACGLTIYTGNAWPAEFLGSSFVAEGAGNLVHRKRLVPDGVGLVARRTEQGREFLTSDEVWFRPIQFANAPAVREKLYAMVADPDVRVRYQLAFTLGEIRTPRATAALVAIAAADVENRWVRLAVLSSANGRAGELFAQLSADRAWRASKPAQDFLEQLAEQVGLANRSDQAAEVLNSLESFSEKNEEKDLTRSVVRGLTRGLKKSGSPLLARLGSGASSSSSSKAAEALAEMIAQAKQLAADPHESVERRVQAIGSLALAPLEEVESVLGRLLDSRQPQEVQRTAIQALGRFQSDRVAEMIVAGWLGFSPQVRGEAAEALFARPERLRTLLAAIEGQVIRPSQLDPARVQFLLSYSDEKIRAEAKRLLESAKLAPREDVVNDWRDVLEIQGDADHGREVFRRECSKCHFLEGVGVELGLPLDTVGNKGPEAILLAVLDPNRDVNPAYVNYVVITSDGLSVTGVITAETATSITLKRAEDESDTVLRTDIDELVNTGISIMPEGLEKLVSKQELADVIAYLMAIK